MEIMTTDQAAEYLGVGKRAFQRYTQRANFPVPFRPGKKDFFSKEEIDQWLIEEREDRELVSGLAANYDDGSELDEDSRIVEFFTDADIDLAEEVISGARKVEDLSPEWVANILDKVVTLALLQKCGQPFPIMGPVPESLKGRTYDREADWASRGKAAQ